MDSKKDNLQEDKFDLDLTPFKDFIKRMDTVFNKSFKHIDSYFHLRPFWVDVNETETDVIVVAELPGYRRDQIQMEIIGNQLRIGVKDSTKTGAKSDHKIPNSRRNSSQQMERTIVLPFEIPEKETKAFYNNGILKVTVPKKNSTRKFIDIEE